jgi:hypothetical protein
LEQLTKAHDLTQELSIIEDSPGQQDRLGVILTTHSSYSEGDHCPLSLSEGPKARTFFSVKGRRPALYFTVSLSEGPQARTFFSVIPQRPALYFTVSLSDSSKPAPYFTVPLSEMQLVRTVTQWAAPKPATSITV